MDVTEHTPLETESEDEVCALLRRVVELTVRVGRAERALAGYAKAEAVMRERGWEAARLELVKGCGWPRRGRGRALRSDWQEVLAGYLVELARGDPHKALRATASRYFPNIDAAAMWLRRRRRERWHLIPPEVTIGGERGRWRVFYILELHKAGLQAGPAEFVIPNTAPRARG